MILLFGGTVLARHRRTRVLPCAHVPHTAALARRVHHSENLPYIPWQRDTPAPRCLPANNTTILYPARRRLRLRGGNHMAELHLATCRWTFLIVGY